MDKEGLDRDRTEGKHETPRTIYELLPQDLQVAPSTVHASIAHDDYWRRRAEKKRPTYEHEVRRTNTSRRLSRVIEALLALGVIYIDAQILIGISAMTISAAMWPVVVGLMVAGGWLLLHSAAPRIFSWR